MATVRFVRSGTDVTVDGVPNTLEKETKGYSDPEPKQSDVGGYPPILREGISKEGRVTVVSNDGGSHSQTIATLIALRSPAGEGDYTVYVDGTEHAYSAIVDIEMHGSLAQLVTIFWYGTISG